ncbi:MAG: TonB family protein [Pseudomonadota bacterium]
MFGWRAWAFGLLVSLLAHAMLASAFVAPLEETLVAGGAEVSVSVLGDAFADAVMRGEPSDSLQPMEDQPLNEKAPEDALKPSSSEPMDAPVEQGESLRSTPPQVIETRSSSTELTEVRPDMMKETSKSALDALPVETVQPPVRSSTSALDPVRPPVMERMSDATLPAKTTEMVQTDAAPKLSPAFPTEPLQATASTAASSAPLAPMEASRSVPAPALPQSPSQQLALNVQPSSSAFEPAASASRLAPVEKEFEAPESVTIPTARPQRKPPVAAQAQAPQKRVTKSQAVTRRAAQRRKETKRNSARARKAGRTQKRKAGGNRGNAKRNARAGTSQGTARRAARNAGKKSRASRRAGNAGISNYRGKLRSRIMRRFRPGRIRGVRRDVVVRFVVSSNGRLRGASIARSSGNSRLDKAALRAVRSAAPFPSFPAGFGRSSLTVTVPMNVGG